MRYVKVRWSKDSSGKGNASARARTSGICPSRATAAPSMSALRSRPTTWQRYLSAIARATRPVPVATSSTASSDPASSNETSRSRQRASCPNERSAPARSYVAPIPLKMRRASSAREEGIALSGTHRAARIVAGCDAPARPIRGPEHDVVRTHRYAVELPDGRRANRRDDRGRARNGRRLTHAFGAVRSVRVRMLDEHRYDRRHVERGRKQVVGERSVPHVSVAELHLLHHRKPEALRDATLDLADDGDRVDRLADVLRRRDLNNFHEARLDVDVDDRSVRREEECDVALVLGVRVARLSIAMSMRDGPVDRLVQKRTQIVGGTAGCA